MTEPFDDSVSISFESVMSEIVEVTVAWKAFMFQQLIESTHLEIPLEDESSVTLTGEQALDLAATVYSRPPACAKRGDDIYKGPITAAVDMEEITRLICYTNPENFPTLNKELSHLSVHLIRLCGLDPITATVHDMDATPQRFICNLCCARDTLHTKITTLTWRETVRCHSAIYHASLSNGNTTDFAQTESRNSGYDSNRLPHCHRRRVEVFE